MADTTANVTFWNQYWLTYTGQTLEQALGRAWDALIHPDEFERLLADYLSATKAQQNYSLEARVKGQNGQYRYFQFTGGPHYDVDGTFVGNIGTGIDIHDRKMAEQALGASEAFARNLFDNSPVANLVMIGPEMIIRNVNEGMLTMLGRDRRIIGQPFMEAMPELRSTPVMDRLRQVLTTRAPYHQPEERIELVRYGQPYTGYYHYIYTPLVESPGQAGGVVVTAIEVTEQVLAHQQLQLSEQRYRTLSDTLEQLIQQRTEELEESTGLLFRSNENLLRFAYVASHDLQEPLRKVQSFGDLIREQYGEQLGDGVAYLERRPQRAACRRSSKIYLASREFPSSRKPLNPYR